MSINFLKLETMINTHGFMSIKKINYLKFYSSPSENALMVVYKRLLSINCSFIQRGKCLNETEKIIDLRV